MKDDMRCPYCEAFQEVNHDDGQGYSESELHRHTCSSCDKEFVFQTSIIFHYNPYKADCLNGSDHKFKPTTTFPVECSMMECEDCGERRKPTDDEMAKIKLLWEKK